MGRRKKRIIRGIRTSARVARLGILGGGDGNDDRVTSVSSQQIENEQGPLKEIGCVGSVETANNHKSRSDLVNMVLELVSDCVISGRLKLAQSMQFQKRNL